MAFWSTVGNIFKTVASPVTSVLGSILGYQGQKETNQANIDQTQAARDWEERMSNTAYQRSRKDLEAAKMNPILAAIKGGASTPNVSAAQVENPSKFIAEGGTNAANISLQNKSIEQSVMTNKALEKMYSAQAESNIQDAFAKQMQNTINKGALPRREYEQKERSKSKGWELFLGDVQRGMNAINPFKGLFNK